MGKEILWNERHPILEEGDSDWLNAEAMAHELKGMPRHDAEMEAYKAYQKKHNIRAAAHHYVGMRAASGEEAQKHAMMFSQHMQSLGLDPNAKLPADIEAYRNSDEFEHPYKFKGHGGDSLLHYDPTRAYGMGKAEDDIPERLHLLWKAAFFASNLIKALQPPAQPEGLATAKQWLATYKAHKVGVANGTVPSHQLYGHLAQLFSTDPAHKPVQDAMKTVDPSGQGMAKLRAEYISLKSKPRQQEVAANPELLNNPKAVVTAKSELAPLEKAEWATSTVFRSLRKIGWRPGTAKKEGPTWYLGHPTVEPTKPDDGPSWSTQSGAKGNKMDDVRLKQLGVIQINRRNMASMALMHWINSKNNVGLEEGDFVPNPAAVAADPSSGNRAAPRGEILAAYRTYGLMPSPEEWAVMSRPKGQGDIPDLKPQPNIRPGQRYAKPSVVS